MMLRKVARSVVGSLIVVLASCGGSDGATNSASNGQPNGTTGAVEIDPKYVGLAEMDAVGWRQVASPIVLAQYAGADVVQVIIAAGLSEDRAMAACMKEAGDQWNYRPLRSDLVEMDLLNGALDGLGRYSSRTQRERGGALADFHAAETDDLPSNGPPSDAEFGKWRATVDDCGGRVGAPGGARNVDIMRRLSEGVQEVNGAVEIHPQVIEAKRRRDACLTERGIDHDWQAAEAELEARARTSQENATALLPEARELAAAVWECSASFLLPTRLSVRDALERRFLDDNVELVSEVNQALLAAE